MGLAVGLGGSASTWNGGRGHAVVIEGGLMNGHLYMEWPFSLEVGNEVAVKLSALRSQGSLESPKCMMVSVGRIV